MNDAEKLTEEVIDNGGILFLMYFDSHATTEDAVKNRLTELFAKIVKENGVVYGVGTIEPPIKDVLDGKEVYSTSGEIKVLTKDVRSAFRLASSYGPVYIEVLKPEETSISFSELQETLNDVSQTSYSLSNYIIKNTLKGDSLKAFLKNVKYREQLGEKLRKEGGKDGKNKER